MAKWNVMKEKIANITIVIPYKRAGNIIVQEPVNFDVFRLDGHYLLQPCMDENERRVANLPSELEFDIVDGKPVSLRGKMDGNLHVIQDAFESLREKNIQIT
jgi:hypothetical protein